MFSYNILAVVASLLVLTPAVTTAQQWEKLLTTRDAYEAYPQRIGNLLEKLDLTRPGLEKVKAAHDRRDQVTACDELLHYYRHGQTAAQLRRDQPTPSSKRHGWADSILNDVFEFYDLTDRVPRTPNGQLDWSHDGPDDDIEWAWGLNRHGHLMGLLRAYFATGNELYAQTIDDHIQDWVVSSLPYPAVKSSTPMWRGLEVALRARVWVQVFYALVNSDHLTPATRILMLTSIPEHTHYLRNFHAPHGNWLTMEMASLARIATAWPEFSESERWVAYAKSEMLEGLADQVYPDGVQKELTSHYHLVALRNFVHFRDVCEDINEPLPDGYQAELEKMENYLAYTMMPSGHGVLNNDSDYRYNRDHIVSAAQRYGRDDWMFIATNGRQGRKPDNGPSVIFPWAGQVIMRSDYDTSAHWGFFDIGPWGTGHQHSDKLHLSITAYGRDLLVDCGRFAYRGALADKFRRYATGSVSHNLILIDGQGQLPGPQQAETPVASDQYKITELFDYATGYYDKFRDVEGDVRHRRSVLYVRGKFWVVVDRVETDRKRKIETLWHWHPTTKLTVSNNNVVSTDHERGNLKIIPVGWSNWQVTKVKGVSDPIQGWYSERYNLAEPTPVSIYSTDIEKTATFVWILQPSERESHALRGEIVASNAEGVRVRIVDHASNTWEVDVPYSNSSQAGYSFTPSHRKDDAGSERLRKKRKGQK